MELLKVFKKIYLYLSQRSSFRKLLIAELDRWFHKSSPIILLMSLVVNGFFKSNNLMVSNLIHSLAILFFIVFKSSISLGILSLFNLKHYVIQSSHTYLVNLVKSDSFLSFLKSILQKFWILFFVLFDFLKLF